MLDESLSSASSGSDSLMEPPCTSLLFLRSTRPWLKLYTMKTSRCEVVAVRTHSRGEDQNMDVL